MMKANTFGGILWRSLLGCFNSQEETELTQVGLDACMANLMRPGMYGAYHHITIIPNSEQMPELPDRKKEMPDNSKDLITKTGIYDVVGGPHLHDVHTHAHILDHTGVYIYKHTRTHTHIYIYIYIIYIIYIYIYHISK